MSIETLVCTCAEFAAPHAYEICELGRSRLPALAEFYKVCPDVEPPAELIHGFPSHLESNPVILRQRIAKANDKINEAIEVMADLPAPLVAYKAIWERLRTIQQILTGV